MQTLTEQLLQYSNRYRSFDERIQEAFNESLEIFEKNLIIMLHLIRFRKLWKLQSLVLQIVLYLLMRKHVRRFVSKKLSFILSFFSLLKSHEITCLSLKLMLGFDIM